jgi:hypothetical protein
MEEMAFDIEGGCNIFNKPFRAFYNGWSSSMGLCGLVITDRQHVTQPQTCTDYLEAKQQKLDLKF